MADPGCGADNLQQATSLSRHVVGTDQFADASCVDARHSIQIQHDDALAKSEESPDGVPQLPVHRREKRAFDDRARTGGPSRVSCRLSATVGGAMPDDPEELVRDHSSFGSLFRRRHCRRVRHRDVSPRDLPPLRRLTITTNERSPDRHDIREDSRVTPSSPDNLPERVTATSEKAARLCCVLEQHRDTSSMPGARAPSSAK